MSDAVSSPRSSGPPALLGGAPARVVVDLDAIAANANELVLRAEGAAVLGVVKGDAYGHGLVPSARAAVRGGATWLGVAQLDEAMNLRRARAVGADDLAVPVISWLHAPGSPFAAAIEAGIDLGAPSVLELDEIAAAARRVGMRARVHLKVDTGLARNGAYGGDWPRLVEAARLAQAGGHVEVVGIMTHFARADEPGHPENAAQIARFTQAVDDGERAGFDFEVRHMSNSPATLFVPEARWDLVRPGLALYGLSPAPELATSQQLNLRPAMSVTANVTVTKRVPADQGVSYGHTYATRDETTLADIPIGYADGVPRHASNAGPVMVAGSRGTIAGRVCMDQFVVDLGDAHVAAGDEAVLFGTASDGREGPSAQEWADAAGTISYEIVTRMGARLPRVYVGALAKEFGL